MKDLGPKLVSLLEKGYCTPQIAKLARHTKEPSTTLQYNIKKLEKEGSIKTYKAVFNHKKIGRGFCAFILISLSPTEYGDPEQIADSIAKHDEVESIDVITGDWELVVKVRLENQEEFYEFVKRAILKPGVVKTKTLTSLKQLKSEFIR